MHRHAVRAYLVCRLVEDEVARLVDRRRRTTAGADRAAEDGLHAGDELLGPERLGDVVVRTELEAAEDVALVLTGGEQEHGDVLVDVPDALQHDEGGELGQGDIQNYEVGLFVPDGLDSALAVVRA